MTSPTRATPDGTGARRWREKLFRFAAPAVLGIVAATQLVLVDQGALSRWKGGGFGMFSTVDSPSARFLRVRLFTTQGEIPVLVPADLQTQAQKVRVMPTAGRLAALTEALRHGTWVPLSMVSAGRHYRDLLRAAGGEVQETADDIQVPAGDGPERIDFAELQLVRMLGEDEALPTEAPLAVAGARVEVWRYTFDREELMLRAEKLTEHTVGGHGG